MRRNEPICRVRGDTTAILFEVRSGGSPVNISGATFTLTVDSQSAPDDPSTTAQFTITGSIEDAPNGLVSFTPNSSQADLAAGTYYYDIKYVDSGSVVIHPVRGVWTQLESRTR